MPTTRSRSGDPTPSERKHVGLTVPRTVKDEMRRAAEVLDWSVGDWVLAAAAEHGPRLIQALGTVEVRKRPAVEDAAFAALYLTPDERDELDDQARAARCNRSAFVTAVAKLALGTDLADVVASLRSASSGAAPPAEGEAGTA